MSGGADISTLLLKVLLGTAGMILLVGGGFCSLTSLLFISFWKISLITLPIALVAGYLGWRILMKVRKMKGDAHSSGIGPASDASDNPKS